MSWATERALADPQAVIAKLQRQLDERTAERDALRRELADAREQQTATAEVLQIINSSPGDLQPVFDAMLERAIRLCEATYGQLATYDGEFFRFIARQGEAPFLRQHPSGPLRPADGVTWERIIGGAPLVHIRDLADTDFYRNGHEAAHAVVDIGGGRTLLTIALRKDNLLLGSLTVYRQEVRPFTDKQIALLQNFAAQAVIAMENARLLTETREALEQQTATAEVLQVINSSPGNLKPVFDAILEKAHALCDASFGRLLIRDGDEFRLAAAHGEPRFVEAAQQLGPERPPETGVLARLTRGEPIVVADVRAADSYHAAPVPLRSLIEASGVRTSLTVPLRKDGALLGWITASRREVRPFTDKQIALLQNFAAQAVIAIENARLLTETREALEQQTATAEVLQVINSSPGDLAPVFDAMLEKAMSLCGAIFGELHTYDGVSFKTSAARGHSTTFIEARAKNPPAARPGTASARILETKRPVHILDIKAERSYRERSPASRALIDLGGTRTTLGVPLLKNETVLGFISFHRDEVKPFTDRQIALLQNFAAQAVIAMENARLLTETREALEQQTATAEVLQVINSSPGNLAPVFDAMLEKAMRLCEIAFGALFTRDGEYFHAVAARGLPPALAEYLRHSFAVPPGSTFDELVAGVSVVQIPDVGADDRPAGDTRRALVELGGARTGLAVALCKDDEFLGAFWFYRQEVRPFTDKQIALLQNFAAQAVIAIENARLLTETREALEQQTATAEVLQVINSSPGNLAPVFDAILEKAHSLCDIAQGSLELYDGEWFRAVAVRGLSDEFAEILRQGCPAADNPATRPLLEGSRFAHILDLAETEYTVTRSAAELDAARTLLCVPLRRDGRLLGMIACARREVRPFSDKEITLLENFAAQAVIAMDNARLLNEIRQRQAELRVTFDNMGDGVAMFDAELRLAAWNMNFRKMLDLPETYLAQRPGYEAYIRYLAARGEFGSDDIEAELSRRLENPDRELRFERTRPDGRVIEVRRNAVPGGGFVLIYSDITERKEAEARLRVARDTAEGALRELRAAQASLVHAEKMASLGQLTAGIAHEIKNPLNFVNNFAGLSVELLDELKEAAAPAVASLEDDERAEIDDLVTTLSGNLDKIAEHGKRADGIVSSMLEHSRGSSGERRRVDLNALVEEALNLAYHGGRARDQSFNITLERDYADAIAPIELIPQDITRVCLNLFSNGFYAATKRQREASETNFKPTLKVSTRDLGEAVEIRVRDNGIGIPPEIKDKLFQPFFTTKPTGEGTGLGLSISYDIVTQQHGGMIEVDSEVGAFTEFTVRLPR